MGDSAPHKALRLIGTGLVILLPVVLALWFAQLRAKAETIDQLHFIFAADAAKNGNGHPGSGSGSG